MKTAKGRVIVTSMAVLTLAGGVWAGARHLTYPARVSPAPLSTPAVIVSDTRPNTARTNESAVTSRPLAESEPQAADAQRAPDRPDRPTATPVPKITEESAKPVRSEERQVSTSISVNDSGVGTDVVDRKLVGRSESFAVGTRVVFWTQIIGGRTGDTIRHVWLHEGRLVATVKLPVGGASWRTQSQHVLVPGAEGEWIVEARDEDGRVLAQQAFRSGN